VLLVREETIVFDHKITQFCVNHTESLLAFCEPDDYRLPEVKTLFAMTFPLQGKNTFLL
jgi:hypothetical protein